MQGYELIGQPKDIILIVPDYNEKESIVHIVYPLRESGYDFAVINDGSTDSTEEALLDELNALHVDLVEDPAIGGAAQTGHKYAHAHGYKIDTQFDGAGQHDVRYIDNLVQPLPNGEADTAADSRFTSNESESESSLARRTGITLLSFTPKAISGKTIKDVTSGFRTADERAMRLFARSYPADYPRPESLAYAFAHDLTAAEAPVAMHERSGGESSIAGLDTVYYVVKVSISILISGSSKNLRGDLMSIYPRLFMAATSILFLCFVVQMIRRERFLLKYSFFWLFLGIFGLIAAIFPNWAIGLSRALGFEEPANFLFFARIVILMRATLTLCSVASRLAKRMTSLTREVSLLKSGTYERANEGQ